MKHKTEMTREELDKLARCEGGYTRAERAAKLFHNAHWMRENKQPGEAEVLEMEALAVLNVLIASFDK